MKTKLLIVVTVFLVLIPWVGGLNLDRNNQVLADGITVSSVVVMSLAIIFSLVSWLLFSWASKTIKITGVLLSVIVGSSLVIPFLQVLGPMAGIIVGAVSGFASFMLQKKIANSTQNRPLIIATITITVSYFVLITMILAAQTTIWNTDDGIGEWTGTATEMEQKSFGNVVSNNSGFAFFLVTIPALIMTGLIARNKTAHSKFLIFVGIALMLEGFLTVFYVSFILFPPTEPPMMRSLDEIDYVLFISRQTFLFSGVIGIFATIAGMIMWRKND
ncbi:MAG: hypothetical protein ACW9W3_01870 [Candidatus Nitrosopumilus sp. bin_68KS]